MSAAILHCLWLILCHWTKAPTFSAIFFISFGANGRVQAPNLRIISWLFYPLHYPCYQPTTPIFCHFLSPCSSSKIWTFDLRIISQLFYQRHHCHNLTNTRSFYLPISPVAGFKPSNLGSLVHYLSTAVIKHTIFVPVVWFEQLILGLLVKCSTSSTTVTSWQTHHLFYLPISPVAGFKPYREQTPHFFLRDSNPWL